MKSLQDAYERAMEQLISAHLLTDEQLDKLSEAMLQEVPQIAASVEVDLRRGLKKRRRIDRRNIARFEKRNCRRWGPAFDELEFMYLVASETGESLIVEWNDEINEYPFLFAALNHLHVKALLTTREILCLMQGGFADGALARWRTLHELAVCSTLLSQSGEEAAERYVASFDFAALKAAKQLNKYATRANMQAIPDDEVSVLESKCQEQAARLGAGLGEEFGWASEVIGKPKPHLLDLEEATGLDHWRPRFRWASQSVHGGYRPVGASLSMAESLEPVHVIGPSNSGMVDPIQMTAISLAIVAVNFFSFWPSVDRLVACKLLLSISQGIGHGALELEAETLVEWQKKCSGSASP